jgi:DNA-binding transcriptional ArsR family regulator
VSGRGGGLFGAHTGGSEMRRLTKKLRQKRIVAVLTAYKIRVIFNHMAEYIFDSPLDQTFHALANPIRREILRLLARGEATVLEVASHFDISLNGVSKHLKVLEKAGLIQRDIQGRTHTCSLQVEPLQEAGHWIDFYRPYWEERLDALELFLQQKRNEDQTNPTKTEGTTDDA